jgi:hypothetical protein
LVFSTCEKLVSVQIDVLLIRGANRQSVPAQLVTTTERHLADYDQFWKPRLQRANAEDSLSDWDWKQRIFVARGMAEGYAIECEQMTQGLIVLRTQGRRSLFDPSRRLVYVSRLATAPWNRSELQSPVAFKLVGSTLLKFAQLRSEGLGYGGLVGVHSLPESEEFYRKLDMQDGGLDEEFENLRYFEWYRPRPSLLDELTE